MEVGTRTVYPIWRYQEAWLSLASCSWYFLLAWTPIFQTSPRVPRACDMIGLLGILSGVLT